MSDPFHLARFVQAQAAVYDTVTAELTGGLKQTHWMWFIFPQLKQLGRSERALFYGIASREEARAYLDHDVLGARLRECTAIINALSGRTAFEIFGGTDELKLRSCMTLFADIAGRSVFTEALTIFFGCERDPETLVLLEPRMR